MLPKRFIALLLIWATQVSCSTPACGAIRTLTWRSKEYVPLNYISQYFTMTESAPAKDRVRLVNKWHVLEFETNGRRCWINGTLVWLNHPVRRIGCRWAIEEIDFRKTIDPAIRPYAYLNGLGRRVVVLDPGHGGKDNGAVSKRRVFEKLVVLDVAKRVRKHLEAKGISVRSTRGSDVTLSLEARTKKAASYKADVFVSIHADAASSRTAKGSSAFALSLPGCYSTHSYGRGKAPSSASAGNRFNDANIALALRIQQHLIKKTGQKDRGVKRARFQVLRDAPCPAALVEMAFLSNPDDEAMVIDANGREKLARGIADGILSYLADIQRAKSPRG